MNLQGFTISDISNPHKKLSKLRERIDHIDATILELKDKREILVHESEQCLDKINGVRK